MKSTGHKKKNIVKIALVAAFVHTNENLRNKLIAIREQVKAIFENLPFGIGDRLNVLDFNFDDFDDLVKSMKMSVFGYNATSNTTVRAMVMPVNMCMQLLQKISKIQADVNSKDRLLAYEIAIKNGFVETVSD